MTKQLCNVTKGPAGLLFAAAMILAGVFTACGDDPGNDDTKKPAQYKVTFDANGGAFEKEAGAQTEESAKILVIEAGKPFDLPALPVKSDADFKEWSTQKESGGAAFTKDTAVNADTTVYAQWKAPAGRKLSITGLSEAFNGGTIHIVLSDAKSMDSINAATIRADGPIANATSGVLPLSLKASSSSSGGTGGTSPVASDWTENGSFYVVLGIFDKDGAITIFVSKEKIAFTKEETVIAYSEAVFEPFATVGKQVTVTGLTAYSGQYLSAILYNAPFNPIASEQMATAASNPVRISESGNVSSLPLFGTDENSGDFADGDYTVVLIITADGNYDEGDTPSVLFMAYSTAPITIKTGITIAYSSTVFTDVPIPPTTPTTP